MAEVMDKEVEKEWHTCDACGYARGFHVSFRRNDCSCGIILICPNCGQRYQIGWRMTTQEA